MLTAPDQADVLADLKKLGAADASVELPDGPQDNGPARDEELAVAAPKLSPAQRMNDIHATRAGGSGFRIRCAGTYYAHDAAKGKGKVVKSYEKAVNIPSLDGAQVAARKALELLLPRDRKYADFVKVREVNIVEVRPLDRNDPAAAAAQVNLQFMDRAGLEEFAQRAKAPIDLAAYPQDDVGLLELREDLIDFRQNAKEDFVKRHAERQAKRKMDRDIARLNAAELDAPAAVDPTAGL